MEIAVSEIDVAIISIIRIIIKVMILMRKFRTFSAAGILPPKPTQNLNYTHTQNPGGPVLTEKR